MYRHFAFRMFFVMGIMLSYSCYDSEHIRPYPTPMEEIQELEYHLMTSVMVFEVIKEMGSDIDAGVELKSQVYKYNKPYFEIVRNAGEVPKNIFVFHIFEEFVHEDSKPVPIGYEFVYSKTTIGIFESLEECNIFEEYARDLNLATQKCHRWESFIEHSRKSFLEYFDDPVEP